MHKSGKKHKQGVWADWSLLAFPPKSTVNQQTMLTQHGTVQTTSCQRADWPRELQASLLLFVGATRRTGLRASGGFVLCFCHQNALSVQ
jgi:hypothetical protein